MEVQCRYKSSKFFGGQRQADRDSGSGLLRMITLELCYYLFCAMDQGAKGAYARTIFHSSF
eukprot:1151964-Pelagomonas_calceolata.AAC.2